MAHILLIDCNLSSFSLQEETYMIWEKFRCTYHTGAVLFHHRQPFSIATYVDILGPTPGLTFPCYKHPHDSPSHVTNTPTTHLPMLQTPPRLTFPCYKHPHDSPSHVTNTPTTHLPMQMLQIVGCP